MTKNENKRDTAPPIFALEASRMGGGLSISISGIISISECSDSKISMKSHSGKINISGEKLSLNIYENHSAEVIGRVKGIGFDYAKG